jgi:hypothetical protein
MTSAKTFPRFTVRRFFSKISHGVKILSKKRAMTIIVQDSNGKTEIEKL